jgi:hypothetical protein
MAVLDGFGMFISGSTATTAGTQLYEYHHLNQMAFYYNICVVGAGGLGSNLAFLLAEQGYHVILIDDDVTDEKFYRRFIFSDGEHLMGVPKVNVVQDSIKKRLNKDIKIYNNKFESIDVSSINCKWLIITTDSIESRKTIERLARSHTECRIINAGCNLNSVSVYKTAEDLIGDDNIIGGSSYDREPDSKTYLMAAISVIQRITDNTIDVFDEFAKKPITSLDIKDVKEGYGIVEYDGMKLVGKYVDIQLKGLYKHYNYYEIKEEFQNNLKFSGFLGCNPITNRFYLLDDNGTLLMNPHTMSGGYLCIGDIPYPEVPNIQNIKNIIERLRDSLEIPNLDSALRSNFGPVNLDESFIDNKCTLEIKSDLFESSERYHTAGNTTLIEPQSYTFSFGHLEPYMNTVDVGVDSELLNEMKPSESYDYNYWYAHQSQFNDNVHYQYNPNIQYSFNQFIPESRNPDQISEIRKTLDEFINYDTGDEPP